jgi:hypothetical protein
MICGKVRPSARAVRRFTATSKIRDPLDRHFGGGLAAQDASDIVRLTPAHGWKILAVAQHAAEVAHHRRIRADSRQTRFPRERQYLRDVTSEQRGAGD